MSCLESRETMPAFEWEIRDACRAMLAVLTEYAAACFDDIVE